jgi:hypothetical protein
MPNPIGIIATALWGVPSDAHQLARTAAKTLTDERIIEAGAEALVAAGWTTRRENARAMAEIVLRSVGEAS